MASVGDSINAENARWAFGGDVPAQFDEHIVRSIPFYRAGHDLVAKLSDFFISRDSLIYELGCATGVLTECLSRRVSDKGARLIAVDIEPDMVAVARERCQTLGNVEVVVGDIVELELKPADLIVVYYTLQFVRPRFRQLVMDKIYESLTWGGALILFEKVRAPDARFQDAMTDLYTDFKLEQGFNAAEIVAKTSSLKGILEPFSTQGNLDMLSRAGFVDVMSVFKYICFEGFLAIK